MNSVTVCPQEYYAVTRSLYSAAWKAEDSTSCSSILAKVAFIAFPIIATIAMLETLFIPATALGNHFWSPAAKSNLLPALNKIPQLVPTEPTVGGPEAAREQLLEKLNAKINDRYEELVSLFRDLESADPIVAEEATATLNFLEANGHTLHHLVLHSLPLWPCNYAAIQRIALDSANSENSTARERAFIACKYLVTHRQDEGFEAATALAAQKLRNENADIRLEGLRYFTMLLERFKPDLPEEDLEAAIQVATQVHPTEDWLKATHFFDLLIKNGESNDILKAKQAFLDGCDSNYPIAFKQCEKIVTDHHNNDDLMAIPLKAAVSGAESEDNFLHQQSLDLFWLLIGWRPELSIDKLVDALLLESNRQNPCIQILSRLNEVTGKNLENQTIACRNVVEERLRHNNHSAKLLQILDNLSRCNSPYERKQALEIKAYLENKLRELARDF